MMIRLFLLWCCLATPLVAAPVIVTSGEHDGFTRLVLDFGAPVDWQVGRTLDGYTLQLLGGVENQSQLYDLTKVFDLIGKGRLAAIWADPQTAQLKIGIACACHAIPFEFRPGILVIDLRDGPPPKGSSFELAMDGAFVPTLNAKPNPRPRPRPQDFGVSYDWTKRALDDLNALPATAPAQNIAFADPTLQSLRNALLLNLSRGAAQGVVDLALPRLPLISATQNRGLSAGRIALGELPGLTIGAGLPDHGDIAGQGQNCPNAEQLAVSTWAASDPISGQMANPATGLVTEFDLPDPTAIGTAVRFQLFLGFGIESRQLIQAFAVDLPDKATLLSLGYILDQDIDPDPAFRGLAACDTPAALWAVLSDPAPALGDTVNVNAVLRAFSELPVHLRRHLGPGLAQRFLVLGDDKTAMTIRNAITRAPGEAGSKVGLMEAEIAMYQGDPAAAETRLTAVLADAGTQASAALVALTNARVAQDLPVDAALVTALESLLVEQAETDDQIATHRALVLAQAASGDFDSAFSGLPDSPDATRDLWRILSKIGSDQAVLTHAVLLFDQQTPSVAMETSTALATRLLGLGLADQALRWASSAEKQNGLLLAEIHIARRDGQSALSALADVSGDSATELRATALDMLGDTVAALQTYTDIGDTEAARRVVIRARDWQQIEQLSPDDWGASVKNLVPTVPETVTQPQTASLARGRQIAGSAAQTRTDLDALLAKIAAP